MELNITSFFNTAAPMDYSASIAEIGSNAGPDTWRASCEDSADYPLLDTDAKREAFRTEIRGYGAWDATEIAAFSDTELNALCIQMISGDMREVPDIVLGPDMSADDWKAYERMQERGTVSGRIFQGIDGEVYYYIGD